LGDLSIDGRLELKLLVDELRMRTRNGSSCYRTYWEGEKDFVNTLMEMFVPQNATDFLIR
jgi:hypothetical protein